MKENTKICSCKEFTVDKGKQVCWVCDLEMQMILGDEWSNDEEDNQD